MTECQELSIIKQAKAPGKLFLIKNDEATIYQNLRLSMIFQK
jgi:hypothetical protein